MVKSSLIREIHPIPGYVKEALDNHKLTEKHTQKSAYQQNDYIGWITRAKRDDTRNRRLEQMIVELKQGGVYMKMKCNNNK